MAPIKTNTTAKNPKINLAEPKLFMGFIKLLLKNLTPQKNSTFQAVFYAVHYKKI